MALPTRLAPAGTNVWGTRIVRHKGQQALVVAAQRAMIQAFKACGTNAEEQLRKMVEAVDLRKIPRATMKEANLRIATSAQDAVLSGWESRLPRKSLPYRPEARLTGALGRALADSSMTSATTDRMISFLNEATLNNEAVHWYRVNYGAAGPNLAQGNQAEAFPVTLPSGQALFALSDDSPPAPASWLPRRWMWLNGMAGEMFVPRLGPADVVGRGVRPARFTDLGLESIAATFGPVYNQTYTGWIGAEMDRLRGSRSTRQAATGRVR